MSKASGIDDDKLIYVPVLDSTVFGPESTEELANILHILDESSKMGLALLAQENPLKKFMKAFYDLIQLIYEEGPKVESPLVQNIQFYREILEEVDNASQIGDIEFTKALGDAKILAKKVLQAFLINPKPEEEPPALEPEISKPRLKIGEMFTKLLGLSHDK